MPRKRKDQYVEKFPITDNDKIKEVYKHKDTRQEIDFQFSWSIDMKLPYKNSGKDFLVKYSNKKMIYFVSPKDDTVVPYGKYAYMVLSYICTQLKLKESRIIYFGTINEMAKKIGVDSPRGYQIERIKECIKGFAKLSMNYEVYGNGNGGTAGLNMRFCERYALSDDPQAPKGKMFYTVLEIAPEMTKYVLNNLVPYDFGRFKQLEEDNDIPIFFWLTRSYYLLKKKNSGNKLVKDQYFDWDYLINMFADGGNILSGDHSRWRGDFKIKLNRIKSVFSEFNFICDTDRNGGVTLQLSDLQIPENDKRYIPAEEYETPQIPLFEDSSSSS